LLYKRDRTNFAYSFMSSMNLSSSLSTTPKHRSSLSLNRLSFLSRGGSQKDELPLSFATLLDDTDDVGSIASRSTAAAAQHSTVVQDATAAANLQTPKDGWKRRLSSLIVKKNGPLLDRHLESTTAAAAAPPPSMDGFVPDDLTVETRESRNQKSSPKQQQQQRRKAVHKELSKNINKRRTSESPLRRSRSLPPVAVVPNKRQDALGSDALKKQPKKETRAQHQPKNEAIAQSPPSRSRSEHARRVKHADDTSPRTKNGARRKRVSDATSGTVKPAVTDAARMSKYETEDDHDDLNVHTTTLKRNHQIVHTTSQPLHTAPSSAPSRIGVKKRIGVRKVKRAPSDNPSATVVKKDPMHAEQQVPPPPDDDESLGMLQKALVQVQRDQHNGTIDRHLERLRGVRASASSSDNRSVHSHGSKSRRSTLKLKTPTTTSSSSVVGSGGGSWHSARSRVKLDTPMDAPERILSELAESIETPTYMRTKINRKDVTVTRTRSLSRDKVRDNKEVIHSELKQQTLDLLISPVKRNDDDASRLVSNPESPADSSSSRSPTNSRRKKHETSVERIKNILKQDDRDISRHHSSHSSRTTKSLATSKSSHVRSQSDQKSLGALSTKKKQIHVDSVRNSRVGSPTRRRSSSASHTSDRKSRIQKLKEEMSNASAENRRLMEERKKLGTLPVRAHLETDGRGSIRKRRQLRRSGSSVSLAESTASSAAAGPSDELRPSFSQKTLKTQPSASNPTDSPRQKDTSLTSFKKIAAAGSLSSELRNSPRQFSEHNRNHEDTMRTDTTRNVMKHDGKGESDQFDSNSLRTAHSDVTQIAVNSAAMRGNLAFGDKGLMKEDKPNNVANDGSSSGDSSSVSEFVLEKGYGFDDPMDNDLEGYDDDDDGIISIKLAQKEKPVVAAQILFGSGYMDEEVSVQYEDVPAYNDKNTFSPFDEF
jgi:hypothetical protein